MGCVGFGLNVISVLFLHGNFLAINPFGSDPLEHDHDHSRGPDREGSQDAIELRDEKVCFPMPYFGTDSFSTSTTNTPLNLSKRATRSPAWTSL